MEDFTRLDGRTYSELRPLYVQLNPLKSGPSCRLTVGNYGSAYEYLGATTSVMAIIFFSQDNKNRNAVGDSHKPTFEVYIRPASGLVSNAIRGMECVLVKALQRLVISDTLGKTVLSMRLQILEDGGGLLSACMNAALTCVLLAGLKIKEIPHAVSFGIIRKDGTDELIVDPTNEELRTYCSGSLTVLCEPKTGEISLTTIDTGAGGIYDGLLPKLVDMAKRASRIQLQKIDEAYRRAFDPARISLEANGV